MSSDLVKSKTASYATELAIACLAVVGMLTRYGLGVLFSDKGLHGTSQSVDGVDGIIFQNLPANIFGSLVMGFMAGLGNQVSQKP